MVFIALTHDQSCWTFLHFNIASWQLPEVMTSSKRSKTS